MYCYSIFKWIIYWIFFLRLNYALSDKGTFSITFNKHGKFVIHYRLSGWDTFFNVFFPYFNLLYGANHAAIFKLTRVYVRINLIKNEKKNDIFKAELVYIAYSLTVHISIYRLDINDKLLALNIKPEILKNIPNVQYSENTKKLFYFFLVYF